MYLACVARSPVDPVEEVVVARTPLFGPGPEALQDEVRVKASVGFCGVPYSETIGYS